MFIMYHYYGFNLLDCCKITFPKLADGTNNSGICCQMYESQSVIKASQPLILLNLSSRKQQVDDVSVIWF